MQCHLLRKLSFDNPGRWKSMFSNLIRHPVSWTHFVAIMSIFPTVTWSQLTGWLQFSSGVRIVFSCLIWGRRSQELPSFIFLKTRTVSRKILCSIFGESQWKLASPDIFLWDKTCPRSNHLNFKLNFYSCEIQHKFIRQAHHEKRIYENITENFVTCLRHPILYYPFQPLRPDWNDNRKATSNRMPIFC